MRIYTFQKRGEYANVGYTNRKVFLKYLQESFQNDIWISETTPNFDLLTTWIGKPIKYAKFLQICKWFDKMEINLEMEIRDKKRRHYLLVKQIDTKSKYKIEQK